MPVGNGSGRDVEYDVQPSGTGGDPVVAQNTAIFLMVAGTVSTAVGCLTQIGGDFLIYLGLGLQVAAIAFQAVALRRSRIIRERIAPFVTTPRAAGSGKTKLLDGEQKDHTFAPGTWIVFCDDQDPSAPPLAISPPIFDPAAMVVLRRCGTPSTLTQQAVARTTVEYFVQV